MRKLWILFAVQLCCVTFAIGVSAVTIATEGDYTYMAQNGIAVITAVDSSISGNVVIPTTLGGSMVQAIQQGVFHNCDAITSVTVPATVTSIGNRVFTDCDRLTAIYVSSANPNYTAVDGVLFTKDQKTLVVYPAGNPAKTYVVPNTAAALAPYAFQNCDNLQAVSLQSGITSIGEGAFYSCNNLAGVFLPNSISSIGEWAFFSCASLTDMVIPASVSSIGNYAFFNCSGLKNITLPNNIASIGECVFYNCDRLTSVTVPDCVTTIGYHAFFSCDSLTSVMIPTSVISMDRYAFFGCANLTIYSYIGSYADTYAEKYALDFVALDELFGVSAPRFAVNLSDKTYFVGDSSAQASMTVLAQTADNRPVAYQWYVSDTGEGDWTAIAGATTATLIFPIDTAGVKYYYVAAAVEGIGGTASTNSQIGQVTVKEKTDTQTPTIFAQTNSLSCEVNGEAALFVSASAADGGVPSYQWYVSDTATGEDVAIPDAVSAGYKPDTSTEGVWHYYVVVTNTNSASDGEKRASVRSSVMKVTVGEAPVFTVTGSLYTDSSRDAVTIELLNGDKVVASVTVAGDTGTADYILPDVPNGTYTLRVSTANHLPYQSTVTVENDTVLPDARLIPYGDANHDGKADSSDAVAILRNLAGYEAADFHEDAADFNGDGKADSSDAVAILRKLAGY